MKHTLTIPLRVVSEANVREHWAAKAERAKAQRRTVAWEWQMEGLPRNERPARVVLTRRAPRSLDSDNLQRAFKAVRDEIAALCGFDDRDESVRWVYAQERAKEYGVRVEVEWTEGAT